MNNKENIELKVFTIKELKRFFIHNIPVELLSEQVISKVRAYSTIMNPFCSDETVVISAIFVNNVVASYTYVFPDELLIYDKTKDSYDKRTIYWNTVLYVNSKYEGRGYGSIVIGQMVEIYGDNYFDLDAVPASIENLKFAGLCVDYIEQYVLEVKRINTNSIKGKIIQLIDWSKRLISNDISLIKDVVSKTSYKLSYNNFIDDESYTFIKKYCKNNLFLRSQQMLNWILSYPFCQMSPLSNRVENKCYFSSNATLFHKLFVQVRDDNDTIRGMYIYRYTGTLLYIEYVYYMEEYKDIVFYSIVEYILRYKPQRFFTADVHLCEFIKSCNIFSKFSIYKKSFSHPSSYKFDGDLYIQAGDGDNFI